MVAFRAECRFQESGVLAHDMVFEIATGHVWIHGHKDGALLQKMAQQVPVPPGDEHLEEEDWWRFELGKLYGSQEAVDHEHNRLTMGNLARLSQQRTPTLDTQVTPE